jgi:cytochrome c553
MRALAALLLAAALSPAAQGYTDLRRVDPVNGDAAAGAAKATLCLACHGTHGTSVAPIFPRLAGQRPGYLYHRLVSFKQSKPQDPYYSLSPMTAIAATLSDADMRNLSAFFATQTVSATDVGSADPAAVLARGESLFHRGDPLHGVPPCQGCHGAQAEGLPTRAGQYALYPSLRGQYGPYLIARLTHFREHLPHDSSNDFVMGGVAQNLDDDSIQALAAWLSSLLPTKSL